MAIHKKLQMGTRRLFFRGIIDLEGLFQVVRQWCIDEEYYFEERTVKHKITSEGALKEIDWEATREVTEYIRYKITIMFKIRDIVNVEVIKKGEKKNLSQCMIILELTPVMELDPYGFFEKSSFFKKLRDWLSEHVMKKDILFLYADQLDYRTLKLQSVIKEYYEFEAKEYPYGGKYGG